MAARGTKGLEQSGMPELSEIRKYYELVAQRYEEAGYYETLPLNKFWGDQNMRAMRAIIAKAKSVTEAVHAAQRTFMFSVNVQDDVKERVVDWLLVEQRRCGIDLLKLPFDIQESELSYPGNNVMRGGLRLTPDFLRSVSISYEIVKYINPDQKELTVIELGGGLGLFARTLKLFGHGSTHVIIDLPESLYFSYCFLSGNFPGSKLLFVSNPDSMAELSLLDYDFVLVPTMFADVTLKHDYDLFVNTASLGEMHNSVIRYWMDFLQNKLRFRYLFTLNRYLNTIIPAEHQWRWDENECSVHYDARWKILKWEVEPPFTRCPYVETLIARYVEIVAERLREIDETSCLRSSQELVAEIVEQDWCRLDGKYPAVMTVRDNILVHDMTARGTLFKLWESIRLAPTAKNVALMIRYLDTLLRSEDREFEENKYYEDLFFELYDENSQPHLREFAEAITRRRKSLGGIRLLDEETGYNILQKGNRYLAVAQSLGPIDLTVEHIGEREIEPVILIADSVEALREKIEAVNAKRRTPVVALRGEFAGYNLVQVGECYFAMAQSLGPVDLGGERIGEREVYPFILLGESLEEVCAKATEAAVAKSVLARAKGILVACSPSVVKVRNALVRLKGSFRGGSGRAP